MKYLYISSLFVAMVVSTLVLLPTVYAETNVVNNISVYSNSGGNTAKNGEVVEGKTNSTVDITTVINDKIVEDIHEVSTGEYVHIEHTATGTNATTTTKIDMQNEKIKHDQVEAKAVPNRNDDTAIKTESSTIINNLNEPSNDKSNLLLENSETPSLFTRLIAKISQTFTYVLSNFFSK